MRKLFSAFLILSMLFLFYACPNGIKEKKFRNAYFPETVTNLENLNSEYDDINMAFWMKLSTNFIVFSSNRISQGGQFDLVGNIVTFTWNEYDGVFGQDENIKESFKYFSFLIDKTQTDADELGPYITLYNEDLYLFYASNKEGTNDVYFYIYNEPLQHNYDDVPADSLIQGPFTFESLSNPNFNEGYLSFHTHPTPYDEYNRMNSNLNFINLIYASDSLGQLDIYSKALDQTNQLQKQFINPMKSETQYLSSLNTEFNDRCPNVCGNFMVFSSDRPGGLGGYDFYYSIFENDQWGDPINFGAPVNSEFDEYRAIPIKSWQYQNDLLVFSSDRPGGMGGFDIYYVGIDLMPDVQYE